MKKNKVMGCLCIIMMIVLCFIVTGCKGKQNIESDNTPKVNIDLDNDGVCDLNCDTNDDGKCDLNCDNNNDGICDMNCDLNKDNECDLNCDSDNDLVADMYVDVNKDLIYDYDDIEEIIKQNMSNLKDTMQFYCPVDYGMSDCRSTVTEIIRKLTYQTITMPYQDILKTELNFDYGNITTSSYRVRVLMKYKYTLDGQKVIDQKIDNVIKSTITSNLDDKDKIRKIHDYIVNNTNLCHDDTGKIILSGDNKDYESICSHAGNIFTTHMANDEGYADLMSLFLTKMGYENVRVYGNSHVWNAVKVDNTWYHIDVYWARPISIDGNNTTITHEYFMLTTKELNSKGDDNHNYDLNKYSMIK